MPKWRILLRIFAPIYFFLFSLLRCYVEAEVLAKHSFFSYYTAWHHILWNTTTILMIILLVSLILKVSIPSLLWLMYGVTSMAIPLFYAMVMGEHLHIEYLRGSFLEIMRHIATFCLTYPRNRPLTIEMLVIFFSMIGVGYYYSRSWPRALGLAMAVHIFGNIIAIHWFGPSPYAKSIFVIKTQWRNHPLMAVIFLHTMTILTMLLIWRAGLVKGSKSSWVSLALWAAIAWIVYVIIIRITGWFIRPFDIIMSALPVTTGIFLSACILSSKRRMLSRWAWATMGLVFIIQLTVMGPIYFHKKMSLIPKSAPRQWLLKELK